MENFKFKKIYGQNFINDQNIIHNIVKKSDIQENSLVIEIGPGAGILTKELCKYSKNVLSYEIDSTLEEILDENLKDCHNVKIIFDDFLKRNLKEDIKDYCYDNIYVIANIPYYITTPIITKLIDSGVSFKKIIIMVQKEVGERFSAKTGTRDYSSITVFLNYYFDIYKLFDVSRNSFTPKPNVDSVVICFEKKQNIYNVIDEKLFFDLIREAFKYKRKNLRNNLKKYNLTIIENVLQKYNKSLMSRAEELDVEIFVAIANALIKG